MIKKGSRVEVWLDSVSEGVRRIRGTIDAMPTFDGDTYIITNDNGKQHIINPTSRSFEQIVEV